MRHASIGRQGCRPVLIQAAPELSRPGPRRARRGGSWPTSCEFQDTTYYDDVMIARIIVRVRFPTSTRRTTGRLPRQPWPREHYGFISCLDSHVNFAPTVGGIPSHGGHDPSSALLMSGPPDPVVGLGQIRLCLGPVEKKQCNGTSWPCFVADISSRKKMV